MKGYFLLCLLAVSNLLYSQQQSLVAGIYESDESELSEYTHYGETNTHTLKQFVNDYLSFNPNKHIYVGCNENNQYYEGDTIRMHRISRDYYPVWECCKFVEWSIVDDAKFLWSDLETCNKEVQRSYYLSTTNVKVSLKDGSIYLNIFRNGTALEHFRLLNIIEVPAKYSKQTDPVLVLLREPKAN